MRLIADICVFTGALAGFLFGSVNFFQPHKAVYAQMITLAAGCIAFGRLYQIVRLLTMEAATDEFQLGILGETGSLLFFFSANFGLMDSLADDGDRRYAKYRITACAAPALFVALYVVLFLLSDVSVFYRVTAAVITVFAGGASYYHLKHLIFPDVDYGVINSLKAYNCLALIYALLSFAELAARSRENETAVLVICILTGLVVAGIVPTVARGIKRWTT